MEDVVIMERTVNEVRFPAMRAEVVGAIRALSDQDYQWSAWIRRELPAGHYDEFTHRIHILYDDTDVMENPEGSVGNYLRSPREAIAIRKLGSALDTLFQQLGTERTDEEYLQAPGWRSVVDAAKAALQVLEEP
jgi:hypothetical protein